MKEAALLAAGVVFVVLTASACRRAEQKRASSQIELPPLTGARADYAPNSPGIRRRRGGFAGRHHAAGATRRRRARYRRYAEAQCAVWRELVGQRAFVLCPRGLPRYVIDSDEGFETEAEGPRETGETGEGDTGDGDTGKSAEGETRSPKTPKAVKPARASGFHHPDLGTLEREVDAASNALGGGSVSTLRTDPPSMPVFRAAHFWVQV